MSDLLSLLQEFHRDKLDMMLRHQAGARHIEQYDVNNTYQYIINRDDVQLSWLEAAIAELGGSITVQAEPVRSVSGRKADAMRQIAGEDARDAQALVDRWRARVDEMSNARHARMLRLILGEVLEQKRFFEQARAGRTDLLGRRGAAAGPAQGDVLPTRWIE